MSIYYGQNLPMHACGNKGWIQQNNHVQLYCCVTFAMHVMDEYTDFKAWYLWTVVYQVQQKTK